MASWLLTLNVYATCLSKLTRTKRKTLAFWLVSTSSALAIVINGISFRPVIQDKYHGAILMTASSHPSHLRPVCTSLKYLESTLLYISLSTTLAHTCIFPHLAGCGSFLADLVFPLTHLQSIFPQTLSVLLPMQSNCSRSHRLKTFMASQWRPVEYKGWDPVPACLILIHLAQLSLCVRVLWGAVVLRHVVSL